MQVSLRSSSLFWSSKISWSNESSAVGKADTSERANESNVFRLETELSKLWRNDLTLVSKAEEEQAAVSNSGLRPTYSFVGVLKVSSSLKY